MNDSPQQTVPEPEFFLLFLLTAIVFVVAATVAFFVFRWGRRKNSKIIKWMSLIPLGCGTLVFAPMLLLLLSWIAFWIFGDTSGRPDTTIGK